MDKLFTKGMVETIDNEKMFIASDDVEDRQGEVISQDGWDLTNFKNNPVIQWAHKSDEPAIATAEKLGFRMVNGKRKLVYSPKFHRLTPMSNYIADLVDAGIIKASSVGFKPMEREENVYTKAELLEISFVNVPANQNALSLGLAKGYDQATIKAVMPTAEFKALEKKETMEENTIGYTKYPMSNEAWDSATEVKDADVNDLKKMCAWMDSEKAELKSSYKLAHHTLSGYKTSLTAVKVAMAALIKGNSGVSEVDARGVYDHLSRHYADFGEEAPEFKSADEIIGKYVENRSADDKIIDLTKTVNTFIEEFRLDIEEKKLIAAENTELFEKTIKKRFEDLELNIQGLQEGFKPGDTGLEQRLLNVESGVEKIANDIREYLTSQPEKGKGVTNGREPMRTEESKKDINGRIALKILNKAVEVLNKSKK